MATNDKARRIDWPRVLHECCRLIERDAPTLDELAGRLGTGRAELQRQFTRRLGTSPKAYAQALALHRLAKGSNTGRSALDAVFDAGFGTNSAAYETAKGALGVTPGQLRKTIRIGWWMGLTDLGWMLLAASDRGICWLQFGSEPGGLLQEFRAAFPKATLHNDEARLYAWFERVRDFILLPREALDLPVDVQGTAFQSRVWRALRKIPLGKTSTYGQIARELGAPSACRAVGAAIGSNRVALVIPCHRVIGSSGAISGYRWGVERKRTLLARESG